ncbi:hypothetical protein AVEN_158563-1 [Araneus ventricosus]|uniref:Uncharacterized protein n=1 Tax=Araneus ventricosus TaxID=182803 RepID=A0A4Y2RUL2_ARAVE|nr:hypothetical protein AVEN_158563-1 [Araneus ventricosus]
MSFSEAICYLISSFGGGGTIFQRAQLEVTLTLSDAVLLPGEIYMPGNGPVLRFEGKISVELELGCWNALSVSWDDKKAIKLTVEKDFYINLTCGHVGSEQSWF